MKFDTGYREFYFIRHCQSLGNVDPANVSGYPKDDPPLTSFGLRQAQALTSRFSEDDIDRIYCSTLIRAVQTVYPTAEKLEKKIELLPGLMEYGTEIDMTDRERLREQYPLAVIRFPEGGNYGGENDEAAKKRAEGAINLILSETKPGERIAVVSHGAIMGFFIRYLLNLPFPEPFHWRYDNCAINHIVIEEDGRPCLASANDRGHLFAAGLL